MRIILRNLLTRLYYVAGDEWAEDRSRARAFPTSAEALKFAQEAGLGDTEIVFTFGSPLYDLSIAVESMRSKPAQPAPLKHPFL